MSRCPQTGISIPECACARCTRRQLAQFAPQLVHNHHDPLRLEEVRTRSILPSVLERLTRPAL